MTTVILGLSGLGCGGVDRRDSTLGSTPPSKRSPVATSRAHGYLNDGDHEPSNDEDQDNNTADTDNDYPEDHLKTENNSYHDDDDAVIVDYGHPASAADRQVITALVRRYQAAAVAGDGAMSCSMLTPSFARAIPEDYGRPPGPSYLRGGKTCAAIMSKILLRSRAEVTTSFAVTGVRAEGDRAYALLGSAVVPASYVQVERKNGSWRVATLLSHPLP
ncbi:MAG TPA: hypothetical protein VIJ39_10305 [Solirubrobacteraceae bacterium]